jgi:outer membrane protein assembly factor BamD (BamD/ComL family)
VTKESEFFLKIAIYNSRNDRPVFRWLREGNISLGVDVAKQFITTKIPEARENQYSVYISLNKSRRENGNTPIYERERQQGQVRQAVNEFDTFIQSKFGFSTQKNITSALSQQ